MNEAETILVIRSLLSSCKSSMNVLVLNNEFRSETGIDIPLFGHKNFIDFLKSIPETVKLTGNYPNQQVSLISSSKSAHIVALVKKQRSKCNAKEINGRLRRTKCDTACGNYLNSLQNSTDSKASCNRGIHNTVTLGLLQHLLKCPNGSSINEIKVIMQTLEKLEPPIRHYNVFNFIKCYPFCLYYNGKFYAVETFKQNMLLNSKNGANDNHMKYND